MIDFGIHKATRGYLVHLHEFENKGTPIPHRMAKVLLDECDIMDEQVARIREAAEKSLEKKK